MDVPQIARIPTKRSKRQSSDGAIQKISKFEEPPIVRVPESFYDIFKKNLTRDDKFLSVKKPFDGLDLWFKQQMLRNEESWPIPRQRHLNFNNSRLFEDFTFPPFTPPKVNWDELVPRRSPASTIWISTSSVLFCIFVVLRLCVYWQRCQPADYSMQRRLSLEQQLAAGRHNEPPPDDTDSMTLSVTSDASNPDLPPPYAEIAASSNGVINKHLDLASEELPPPYSVCLGVVENTNEIAKVHKRQSVEETQSPSNTDSLHNNLTDASNRTNVGQNNVDIESVWVRFDNDRRSETTIEISDLTK